MTQTIRGVNISNIVVYLVPGRNSDKFHSDSNGLIMMSDGVMPTEKVDFEDNKNTKYEEVKVQDDPMEKLNARSYIKASIPEKN